MKELSLFFRRFLNSPTTVGALLPSSKNLAKGMTTHMSKKSARYLEVGAGCGAFTTRILARMQEGDTLDIVEIDPNFCHILKKKFSNTPFVQIHEKSILELDTERFDHIISGLPLNAFSSDLVDQILMKFKQLGKPGCTLSYFEYMGIGAIKEHFAGSDFRMVRALKKSFIEAHGRSTNAVWWNFPPARVYHCRLP